MLFRSPERYYFNVKELLERKGHDIIPFSIKSERNVQNEYEKYFLEAVDDEVYFTQSKKTVKTSIMAMFRMFYSFEAKRKFKQLLLDTKPDIVYIMQYHNKISPSIIYAAKELNIPVVHRISDFQYMCPNALFYNDVKGICEDCLTGNKLNCIKYKCVLNSSVYSAIKLSVKMLHDTMNVTKKIDAFVVPSSFTLSKLNIYGISDSKLNHIPTFFNLQESVINKIEYQPFVLFIGRIEKQKGLMTLVKAFEKSGNFLKIIGFSNDGYEDELKEYLKGKTNNIEFLGKKDFKEIIPYLSTCLCTVVPSEWYDNFPNVILESFAYKKAVIATNIGSLPELVINNETGLCFNYGDINSLNEKVNYLFENHAEAIKMGENAFNKILTEFSPEIHYNKLINLFSTSIKQKVKK